MESMKKKAIDKLSDEADKKFRQKLKFRHIVMGLLSSIVLGISGIVGGYFLRKDVIDVDSLIILCMTLVFGIIVYMLVYIFELIMNYYDDMLFQKLFGEMPLTKQLDDALVDIRKEMIPLVEKETMKTLEQFIVKSKDDIEELNK